MWWTQWPSRSTDAPIDITHASGTSRVAVNQQIDGARWNSLGVYTLSAGVRASVTLLAPNPSPTSYCADAVRFAPTDSTPMPLAVVDSIDPNPAAVGETVSFTGHGTGGTISAYQWASSINGPLVDDDPFRAICVHNVYRHGVAS